MEFQVKSHRFQRKKYFDDFWLFCFRWPVMRLFDMLQADEVTMKNEVRSIISAADASNQWKSES